MRLGAVPLWLGLFGVLLVACAAARKTSKQEALRKKNAKPPNHIKTDIGQRRGDSVDLEHPKRRKTEKLQTASQPRHKVKRRKIKHKAPRKGPARAKAKKLSDEPIAVRTTLPPNVERDIKRNADGARRSHSANRKTEIPGWIPHVAKRKCDKCLWQDCPLVDAMREYCPSGVVRDQCNCCPQCASGVGMPCYLSRYAQIWLPPCGDDLECVPVFETGDDNQQIEGAWGARVESEGVCSCIDQTPVCGSNNATYDNLCEFRETASRLTLYTKTSVTLLHRGPCNTAPKIDSRPSDAVAPVGKVVSFRCETSGFPLPRITWLKRTEKKKKVVEDELPGYFNHAVTQMRGGPGKYQLTTWLTLDKVKESDRGNYVCRSSNDYGTVDGTASLKLIGL